MCAKVVTVVMTVTAVTPRRCQRLLTLACRLRRAERVCGSVLERFCRRVGADEAGNDGGGEDSESPAGEVDRFDRLLAPKLLDGERVTVETANRAKIGVSAAADRRLKRAL